jgi:UDP-N-acetylmuramoyl-L-alanyl-D-glutamate--2,6-diaminopimelate ligase
MKKKLSALCGGISVVKRYGDQDPEITGLSYDSRKVEPGHLFFALVGATVDGHAFIREAVENGAAAVIHSQPVPNPESGSVYLQVERSRNAVAPVASSFFGNPSEELYVIGITGTDGKSTTVSMIHQFLEILGYNAGFLSTVQYKCESIIEENRYKNTTPEAVEIQALLRRMADNGKQYAVIEASSHGLSKKNNRLGNISFDCAVLTNLTHEHLEFHGSFEDYRQDKANLFRFLNTPRSKTNTSFGVVNLDDPSSSFFIHSTTSPVYTYSTEDASADLFATCTKGPSELKTTIALQQDGKRGAAGTELELRFKEHNYPTFLPMAGSYNIENLLASVLVVHYATGTPMETICDAVTSLTPAPGRMTPVSRGQPFSVTVDFAHTPGAFSKLLPAVKKQTEGKLIVLFGSAGERDRNKRVMQGAIAEAYADIIVLADEDPRNEQPEAILEHIASACSGHQRGTSLFLIPDRKKAIRKALSLAGPGDAVLLLGKGHEDGIYYASRCLPWDEVAVAEEILSQMGYGIPAD